MRIGIVVDSTCDLPESYFEKNNIQILPISIRLGDELLVDKRDAQATRRFYQEQLDSEGIHAESIPYSVDQFQAVARDLCRTVEEDPRDLTAARKYLTVYLLGARDATIKFADIFARSGNAEARADYLALLDDLEQNFAARNEKLLLEDRGDLNIEIDVLRARLEREGVQLDRPS